MDFRAQRYRDRLRAEGRAVAVRTCQRTRDILDGYVGARRGTYTLAPRMKIMWGRVIALGFAVGAAVYFASYLWK